MTAPDRLEGLRDLLDDEAIIFDGLDDAIVGVGMKHSTRPCSSTTATRSWRA